LITELTERESLIPDSDIHPSRNSTNIMQQQGRSSSSPLSGCRSSTNLLPSQPCTSDSLYSSLFDDTDIIEVDSDSEFASTNEEVKVTNVVSENSLEDILSGLAKKINDCKISKFNICRSDVWDGAKRGLTRKSFCPSNKISVRFSDDFGRSEGAIDWGGPTREFFTLVLSWIVNSQLFCGPENNKFLSCNAECLHNSEYLYAGQIVALSLVHGGPGIKCLSAVLFYALVHGPDKSVVTIEDVYDPGLKSSLEQFSKAKSVKEAYEIMSSTNLDTILELGGTLQLMKSIEDIQKVVQQTAHWYVLGRSWPALEQFKQGNCLY
jgi:hypothetical protein